MTWMQVEVLTLSAGIDPLCAALEEIGVTGFVINDPADFEQFLAGKQSKWDFVDESLRTLQSGQCSVTFYLPEGECGQEQLAKFDEALARLKELDESGQWGVLSYRLSHIEEESWQDSWKQFWHCTRVGERLVVCPGWEEYLPACGETVIRLDPGMAFGTGTHETTRLCMELAEKIIIGGERVLDLGCGSGILAITALLLGADNALGVDIDEVAVHAAGENAALNDVSSRAFFRKGNLTDNIDGSYNIIFSNIVADVILALIPDIPRVLAPGGALVVSGILSERVGEINAALEAAGLRIKATIEDSGWAALEVRIEDSRGVGG